MTLDQLRRHAVSRSLFVARDLQDAVDRMGYVQADPIRAPARAQDLILRLRVPDYRIDDLEQRYPELSVIEDVLHNYGFFPADHRRLLYPRVMSAHWREFMDSHKTLRKKALKYLLEHGEAHPRDIEKAIGTGARANGWGGTSSATTLMLEGLHREGKAHVVRRDAGIRVYAPAPPRSTALPAHARADELIRLVAKLYAPLPLRSLTQLVSMMGSRKPDVDYTRRIELMIQRGELASGKAEGGLVYVWPADEAIPDEIDDQLHFLAPFDPIVWDRRRFEHLWGWAYRFEAYTPAPKRKLGYYALPLLWRDRIIGWANASVERGKLSVKLGYANKKPPVAERAAFALALEAETDRFKRFLRLD